MPVSPPEWGSAFLKTPRGQILSLIRRGPSTAAELAEATGITPNGVRSQLLILERDGWIRPGGRRRLAGAGKPSTEYEFSPQGERLLSAAYRPFLLALLESLRDRLGQAEVASALEAAGRRLAAQVRPDGTALDQEGAIAILEEMGASISVTEEGGRVLLQGTGCPIGDMVAIEPKACEGLASFVSGLLHADVRTICEHQGRPRCRFEVLPSTKRKRPG